MALLYRARLRSFTVCLAMMLLFLASASCCYLYLDPESMAYLVGNAQSDSFLTGVFDIRLHDYGIFRARELSYAFDILDAHLLVLSYRSLFPNFLSWTHYFGIGIILWAYFRFSKKYLTLTANERLILAFLFLTSPVVFFSGFYFRTAKVLVAVFVFFITWRLLLEFRRPEGPPLGPNETVETVGTGFSRVFYWLLWLLPLVLLDEQGVLFCGLFLLAALLNLARRRDGISLQISFSHGLAIVMYAAYRFWLGPAMVQVFSPVPLDPVLQAKFSVFNELVPLFLSVLDNGILLTWHWFMFLFGSYSLLSFGVLCLLYMSVWPKQQQGKSLRAADFFPLFVSLGIPLALIFCNTLMRTKHLLDRPEVERVYYGLPMTAFLMALVPVGISEWNNRFPKLRKFSVLFLGCILFANFISLPHHRTLRMEGVAGQIGQSYNFWGDTIRMCARIPDPLHGPKPERPPLCEMLKGN